MFLNVPIQSGLAIVMFKQQPAVWRRVPEKPLASGDEKIVQDEHIGNQEQVAYDNRYAVRR
jgi:hypothetical protein